MASVIINGRRVNIPSNTTDEHIRRAGGIGSERTLIRRTREGNHVVKGQVSLQDGDVFVDAPKRVKG